MLDLKAKLLAAGLVTEAQVEKVESEQQQRRDKRKRVDDGARHPDAERWRRRIEELAAAPKSEQYDAIRGWVQRTRLDPQKGLPSEEADRFHFPRADGHISWLTLEPDVKQQVSEGKAGIIAFMSHNGLTHCVVPREVALDVGAVKREWVRFLDGFEVVTAEPRGTEPKDAEPKDAEPKEAEPGNAAPSEG